MTRQIKFRVWKDTSGINEQTGEFERGGFMFQPKDNFVYELNNIKSNWAVMQFTGLLDKNGKEIYEGDIVELPAGIRKEVIFHKGTYCYKRGENEYHIFNETVVEIIGNIYQNPELLPHHES